MTKQTSENEPKPDLTEGVDQCESGANQKRRKIAVLGATGAGVLMSLSSRSALGAGFGQCGSESVSAAMSRHGEVTECGCSPGFWWRSPHGVVKWSNPEIIPAIYGPNMTFNAVFGVDLFKANKNRTLIELGPGSKIFNDSDLKVQSIAACNNIHAILFHAVAALLNAAFYGVRYPSPYQTPAAVITAFQNAFMAPPDAVCASLTTFKNQVDVYDGLWCFNGKDWE